MIRVSKVKKRSAEKMASSSADSLDRQMAEKIDLAQKAAGDYVSNEVKLEKNMVAVMACVYELHDIAFASAESEVIMAERLKRDGIRITKNTPNRFIPLLKLVAPQIPKQTLGRSAAVLDYAQRNDVLFFALAEFISEQGGIVKCEKASRASLKPKREQQAARKHDDLVQVLRRNGQDFDLPKLMTAFEQGLSRCLIERRGDKLVMLAVKPEKSAAGYSPLIEQLDFDWSRSGSKLRARVQQTKSV